MFPEQAQAVGGHVLTRLMFQSSFFPGLQIVLHRTELQTLRDELQRQKELRAQDNRDEALSCALSDRDEAVNK